MDDARPDSIRQLLDLVREDWAVNGDWTKPGCQAVVVYRFGVWRLGIRQRLFRAPFSLIYRILHVIIRNFYGIELYDTARLGRRFLIGHQSGIVVHPQARIGDDCIIRQGVTIGQASNFGSEGVRAHPPVLGNRVSVGAGAVLIGGIAVGDDVVIGPNAVVMTDVPAGSVVACPPGRVLPRPPQAPRGRPSAA